MRVVFMGSPAFAVHSLDALVASAHDVCAVYTQPPRKAGRGHRIRRSLVHERALVHGIDIVAPDRFADTQIIRNFRAYKADIGVVVAFGQILPVDILEAPKFGCINLHASLLPRWRGASPIQRAIMAGDKYTGVQVMQMDEGLDTGPVILSHKTEITPVDSYVSLHDRLAKEGARLLLVALASLEDGTAQRGPQSTSNVSYAPKIKPIEARIDWRQPADHNDRIIRALAPFPGAWTEMPDRHGKMTRVKILEAGAVDGSTGLPGEVTRSDRQLQIACGDGALGVRRLQRDGKAVQDITSFLSGFPVTVGTVLL